MPSRRQPDEIRPSTKFRPVKATKDRTCWHLTLSERWTHKSKSNKAHQQHLSPTARARDVKQTLNIGGGGLNRGRYHLERLSDMRWNAMKMSVATAAPLLRNISRRFPAPWKATDADEHNRDESADAPFHYKNESEDADGYRATPRQRPQFNQQLSPCFGVFSFSTHDETVNNHVTLLWGRSAPVWLVIAIRFLTNNQGMV